MAEGTDPQQPGSTEQPTNQQITPPTRPDYIPEKFWDGNLETSAQKLAASYQSLEKKLSQPRQPLSIDPQPPAIDDEAGLDTIIEKAGFDRETLAKTIAENGDLSAEQYGAFRKMGFGKKIVQDTIAGIAVAQQQAVDKALDESRSVAGGQKQLDTLLTFAAGLPQSVKDDLNRRLGNSATMVGAVLEIQGHYNRATGNSTHGMLEGSPAGDASAKAYRTRIEFLQGAKAAATDPDAKARHIARLGATDLSSLS